MAVGEKDPLILNILPKFQVMAAPKFPNLLLVVLKMLLKCRDFFGLKSHLNNAYDHIKLNIKN